MENFIKIECCNCGVLFAVSVSLNENWQKTKKSFSCPNGHAQSYTKSTEDILKEQLEMKERSIVWKDEDIERLEKENQKLLRFKNKKKK